MNQIQVKVINQKIQMIIIDIQIKNQELNYQEIKTKKILQMIIMKTIKKEIIKFKQ